MSLLCLHSPPTVHPEIEVAPGLSRRPYYSCLYFPLHMKSVLQTALLDVQMQPNRHHLCVCTAMATKLFLCDNSPIYYTSTIIIIIV